MDDLVGRDVELERVRAALASSRLVTLTGPAGVGKTSLAAAAARAWQARAEGARGASAPASSATAFCDLSDAHSVNGAHSALAAALGARLVDVKVADEAAARLAQALAARATQLLVIDNCEHVRDAAIGLIELALGVEGLTVLVTSREALGVRGEHVLAVPQLTRADATSLLFARARAAVPDLVVDDAARATAERVVEKLDRLPLAIELFAARLDLLTLPELEARLDRPLAVLRSQARAGQHAGRHADVAAAIRCSWDLLGDDERLVMRACAVFRGGATFDALAAALARLGYQGALLDDLAALRRKYLLFTERQHGGVRYHTLETAGAFVEAVLDEEHRSDELAVAHAHAVIERASTAAGLDAAAAASVIDNLHAALGRCAAIAPELAARAGLALHQHMATQGPMHAHLEMLDDAIACADASGIPDLCRRLYAARGDTRRKAGRLSAAAVDLEEALAHADTASAKADVRASQAMLAMTEGDLDAAAASINDAIAIADGAEDTRALGRALQRAGAIHLMRGAYPLVEEVCLRALRCLEKTPDDRSLTNALTYLGIGRLDRGDHAAARAAFEEARAKYVEQHDPWSIAVCDAYLALIVVDQRDHDAEQAVLLLERARADAQRVGHARLEAFVDAELGIAHHLAGRLDDAERCLRRGVGLSLQVKDIIAGAVNAGHLAAVLADARFAKGSRAEARHWLDTGVSYAQLMPNPSGRAALTALEGLLALADGDRAGAEGLRRLAVGEGVGVHLRLATRILDDALARDGAPAPVVARIAVSRSGRRVVLGGRPEVDFTRRGAMRRILLALVAAHREGRALDVNGLIAAGWPGEFVETEAGTARVYTAIKSLRRLGLEGVLVTRDDGYGFAQGTLVEDLAE